MKKPAPPKLKKFPAAKQRLLDELLEKNSEGTISSKERVKLEQLVLESERMMGWNARLAKFSRNDALAKPVGAVPVTVWVAPQPAET